MEHIPLILVTDETLRKTTGRLPGGSVDKSAKITQGTEIHPDKEDCMLER